MIRELKKTVILTLVFSVFFASFLCCCLTGASQASSKDIQSGNPEANCHSGASKAGDSKDSKDCKCQQTAVIMDSKGFDSLMPDLQLVKLSDNLFVQNCSLNKTVEEPAVLTEHSPPIAYKRAIPLYLDNSVFRL